jgi:hypothetical protein
VLWYSPVGILTDKEWCHYNEIGLADTAYLDNIGIQKTMVVRYYDKANELFKLKWFMGSNLDQIDTFYRLNDSMIAAKTIYPALRNQRTIYYVNSKGKTLYDSLFINESYVRSNFQNYQNDTVLVSYGTYDASGIKSRFSFVYDPFGQPLLCYGKEETGDSMLATFTYTAGKLTRMDSFKYVGGVPTLMSYCQYIYRAQSSILNRPIVPRNLTEHEGEIRSFDVLGRRIIGSSHGVPSAIMVMVQRQKDPRVVLR